MESKVIALASELFQKHGIVNYSFGFDRAIRRAGLCDYTRRRITLSKHLLANSDLDQIEQVLLHEIAHALVGKDAGHGRIWKQKASEIGYRHERIDGSHLAKQSAKWQGSCPQNHEHFRSRKPTRALSCKLCAPSFSRRYLISWVEVR
ncbi:MAG: M48 family peptidase [Actinobacteria bacterium]|nr:M48 family peptidase [Actinomycetota bacterium]